MRKSTRKILSILIAVAMIFTLIPFGVMAASTGPKKASESSLGSADADYTLNIVNDAATVMLFTVKVNGASEDLSFDAGQTLSIGVNEGDTFEVSKVGNSNYKVLSEEANFQSGDYENVITKNFTHKVGAGFKTGEREVYVQRDGSYYEGDVETISGNYAVKGSKIEAPLAIKSNTNSGAVLGITVNGTERTTTVSGNFASSNTNSSTATSNGTKLTNAANEFFATIVDQIPGYDAARYAILNGKIEGKTVSSGGCNSTTTTEYSVTTNPAVYVPLEKQIIDIVDDVALGDITLTYTTETQAKAGNVDVNVLNGERLDDLHSKLTIDTVTSLMSLLTSQDNSGDEGAGMSADAFTSLLGNEKLMSLIGIEALDNMPKGFSVVLEEVNKDDGLFEGLVYEIPMTETMFIHIDMDVMMQEALGSIAFNLAKGQIPAEMLEMELTLPVSIGQNFALEGVRAGQYTMTITSPGEGWYPAAANTFTVNITDGKTATDFGGNHVYGNIRTSQLIDPLTSAMGLDLGCLGSLAGLMLGNNSVKFVNTTGVVFNHKQNHIEFTNATLNVTEDGKVTTTGIPGATFTLVDRDRFLGLINSLLAMGRTAVDSVIGGISFDELLGLQQEITECDPEEPVDAEPGMIDRVLLSIIALGPELDGFKIPAILENVADENGLVTFDPENNETLQKLIDLIPTLTNLASGIGDIAGGIGGLIPGSGDSSEPGEPAEPGEPTEEPGEGETPAEPSGGSTGNVLSGLDMASILELLGAIGDQEQIDALMGLLDSFGSLMPSGDGDTTEPTEPTEPTDPTEPTEPGEPTEQPDMMETIMNLLNNPDVDIGGDLGFALLNFIGLTEGRFPTGNYLLIQTAVPEGRTRNPMMYIFENTWDAEEKAYHTYASVDIANVMSNEQFAEFAGRLAESYDYLVKIFGDLATGTDGVLTLARTFVGEEGEGWNAQTLLDEFDRLTEQVTAAYYNQDNLDPENPAAGIPFFPPALKQALGQILNTVLDTYIPKATVLTYVSQLIYENTGNLFESQEEVAELVTSLALNGDYTFSDFNNKVQALLDEANFVLNGEVTKNWYYYDVSPNIFTNINVAYHYVINMLLPPELANVVERALQSDIEAGEAMIDELIIQIMNPDNGEVEVPDEPDQPDQPGTNPGGSSGGWLSNLFGSLFGGGSGGGWLSNLFGGGSSGGIGGFFRNLFGGWF